MINAVEKALYIVPIDSVFEDSIVTHRKYKYQQKVYSLAVWIKNVVLRISTMYG